MTDRVDKRAGFGAFLTLLQTWHRRDCERYELARMRARDFGDLPVPPDLIREETRRWPWQKPSPQWGQIDSWRDRDRERPPAQKGQQNPASLDGRDGVRAEPVPLVLL